LFYPAEVSEAVAFDQTFIRLVTQEDFSAFVCHENLKSYAVGMSFLDCFW
jgi:hypothetical protein